MRRDDSRMGTRLVFAVGCRRSGTNWLQRTLATHPAVVGMPSETYLFSRGLGDLAKRFQHANPGSAQTGTIFMPRTAMLEALGAFADRVFEENLQLLDPNARYLVERTPWHVYDLELIGEVYPSARVIHIIRDGRDVARSLHSKQWGPETLAEAAEEWRSSVEAGRHSGRTLGERYMEVRYEELLADPEIGFAQLFGWLGLDHPPEVMQRALAEARSGFNIDPKAPAVASGKWLGEFSRRDLDTVERIGGDLLDELGYARAAGTAQGGTLRHAVHGLRRTKALRRPGALLRSRLRRHEAQRLHERLHDNYVVFEEFQKLVAAGKVDAALGLLSPDARVAIHDDERRFDGRCPDGADALAHALRAHEDLEPEVLTGHVHVGVDSCTSMTTYRLGDGRTVARTLTISVGAGAVTSVSLFRFAIAPDAESSAQRRAPGLVATR